MIRKYPERARCPFHLIRKYPERARCPFYTIKIIPHLYNTKILPISPSPHLPISPLPTPYSLLPKPQSRLLGRPKVVI
ncbi:MAG: hypothetical protein F6K56_44185 [Moorea sp. SIO3G5]|nr:hypothetical protein [Moorena sp. SIO3G5]